MFERTVAIPRRLGSMLASVTFLNHSTRGVGGRILLGLTEIREACHPDDQKCGSPFGVEGATSIIRREATRLVQTIAHERCEAERASRDTVEIPCGWC